MPIKSVTGWSLTAVCALDALHPQFGLAGVFLRASAERRQSIAAFLSQQPWATDARASSDDSMDGLEQVAELLARRSPRDVLIAAFGGYPQGLRGALGRVGHQPQMPPFYRSLYRALTSDTEHSVARAVRQMKVVDHEKLHALRRLPPILRRPALLDQIPDLAVARDVAEAFKLVASLPGRSEESVANTLKSVSRAGTVKDWAERALDDVEFPPNPVPRSPAYRAIMNGHELRRVALRYRNCGRTLLVLLVEGQSALAEMTTATGVHILVHLQKKDDDWVLEDIYVARNRGYPVEWRAEVLAFLAPHGVGEIMRKPRNLPTRFAPLQRLANIAGGWWLTI